MEVEQIEEPGTFSQADAAKIVVGVDPGGQDRTAITVARVTDGEIETIGDEALIAAAAPTTLPKSLAGGLAVQRMLDIGSGLFGNAAKALKLISNPWGDDDHVRDRRHLFNRTNAANNRQKLREDRAPRSEYLAAVDSLTGYERHKWAAAGYPGQRSRDPKQVLDFKGIRERRRHG